jgi:hypothetical protein
MAIPQDPRVMLDAPPDAPDYIRVPSTDPNTARHNKAEWNRIKRIQDQHHQSLDGRDTFAVPAEEFWGNDSLDEVTVADGYDPWGRD